MTELSEKFESIFKEMQGALPAEFCVTCCNAEPGTKGGCFLRLKPIADPGTKLEGAKILFAPISETQSLNSAVLRSFCEGYNDSIGFPEEHLKHGGWLCSHCGFYLSKEKSVDSQVECLPRPFRTCPGCGNDGKFGDGFYAV